MEKNLPGVLFTEDLLFFACFFVMKKDSTAAPEALQWLAKAAQKRIDGVARQVRRQTSQRIATLEKDRQALISLLSRHLQTPVLPEEVLTLEGLSQDARNLSAALLKNPSPTANASSKDTPPEDGRASRASSNGSSCHIATCPSHFEPISLKIPISCSTSVPLAPIVIEPPSASPPRPPTPATSTFPTAPTVIYVSRQTPKSANECSLIRLALLQRYDKRISSLSDGDYFIAVSLANPDDVDNICRAPFRINKLVYQCTRVLPEPPPPSPSKPRHHR